MTYRYKRPAVTGAQKSELLASVNKYVAGSIGDILSEYCFYIEAKEPLSPSEIGLLRWLLSETFEPGNFSTDSFLADHDSRIAIHGIVEVGPRMNFTTAWSTNAVSVCHACGLTKITRIERSRRFRFVSGKFANDQQWSGLVSSLITDHSSLLFDRMTECPYPKRL